MTRRLVLPAAIALLLLCLAIGGFWLSGGRWLTVRTPSMAESAPVGTLLVTEPLRDAPLHAGEFIVFRPPTDRAQRYAHRIVSITADGSIHTKGDLNSAPDPWTLHRSDIAGRVVARFWGAGRLLRALPYLLIGSLAAVACTRYWVRPAARLPVDILLISAVISLTLYWQRPLVRAEILDTRTGDGSTSAALIGTGLLPIRAHAAGAGTIALRPGERGMVVADHALSGSVRVNIGPHLSLLLWLVLVCCWLLPLVVLVVIGVRPRELKPSRHSLTS